MKLFHRTERSMIFPRCWPRPCALINPATHISGDVHYSRITSVSKENLRCVVSVLATDVRAAGRDLEKEKVRLWSLTPLHILLINLPLTT